MLKIKFLTNLQLLFNLANFLPFLMINNDHSAYSEVNLKLSIYSFIDVTGILRMYIKNYNAEKISLTNFLHVRLRKLLVSFR